MLIYLGKEDLIIPIIFNMVYILGSPKRLSELAGLLTPGINSTYDQTIDDDQTHCEGIVIPITISLSIFLRAQVHFSKVDIPGHEYWRPRISDYPCQHRDVTLRRHINDVTLGHVINDVSLF
jgi:hypothetical protein